MFPGDIDPASYQAKPISVFDDNEPFRKTKKYCILMKVILWPNIASADDTWCL